MASSTHFSIDDAFAADDDDAAVLRVYGATTERSPLKPKSRIDNHSSDMPGIRVLPGGSTGGPGRYKPTEDSTSRDSDSLMGSGIGGGYSKQNGNGPQHTCFAHPKVRDNWTMVLAAVVLLIVGLGLLATGVAVVLLPSTGLQGFVFFIAGFICFVPGAYHVVYIYLAAKGRRGYDFYHLPLFN